LLELTKVGYPQPSGFHTWIGMQLVNSTWRWIDGTIVNYSHWGFDSPWPNDGACALIFSDNLSSEPEHEWETYWDNYLSCTTRMRTGVCKKPAILR
jgi:hypothetical protein